MNTKKARSIPTDTGDLEDTTPADWARDDRPDPHFARIDEDPQARAAFERALAEIHEHQATLAQVRKAKHLTQATIAELLEMDQSEVSRLERRTDMLLSTLRSFIQAAGGELHLVATFPNTTPVQLLVGERVAWTAPPD